MTQFFNNLKFEYRDTSSIGIFENMRIQFGDSFPQKFVNIKSLDFVDGQYCTYYTGTHVTTLLDGSLSTAWANNVYSQKHAQFTIDFKTHKFVLQHYFLYTVCLPEDKWMIEGSNDEITWKIITKETNNTLVINQKNFFAVTNQSLQPFRYFRFSDLSEKRFHLAMIDLFGILNPSNIHCNCMINTHFPIIPLVFIGLII